MFSNSSNFAGASSVLKEKAALRDSERHRAKRSSSSLSRMQLRVGSVGGLRLSSLTLVKENNVEEVLWEMVDYRLGFHPSIHCRPDFGMGNAEGETAGEAS
ncbi:unnamed protein product [Haemonchus placei]|uniref:Uncharacterized protein n=1 Tax=Haemonchus placei TaxID=6290 RepID=A0A0N4X3H5_HAEPC|nr:unnamed protein product [Haemonchus placei]